MKIIIIANEFPYPPNHGGRVDIWNRISAFKKAGHTISLITWQEIRKGDIPSKQQIKVVSQVVNSLFLLGIARNWERVMSLLRYPSLVGARFVKKKQYQDILEETRNFAPDFIFVDGVYGALLGLQLKKDLSIPIGVRLHNIESSYMQGQLLLAKKLKDKLSLMAACLHLKSYEETIIAKCDAFFDISLDDLIYWNNKGFKHGHWLPIISMKNKSDIKPNKFDYDVGFLGNLNTPNNVEGLKWFINSVLPLLLIQQSNLKILLLGSEPSNEIIELCNSFKSIELIANPENPDLFLDKVNVLINPVQFGSGVNVKSVEMLMRNNEVVTTSIGIKGMPKEISDVFFIADTPEQFSDSISNILLHNYRKDMRLRHEMREIFKEKSIEIVIEIMSKLIH